MNMIHLRPEYLHTGCGRLFLLPANLPWLLYISAGQYHGPRHFLPRTGCRLAAERGKLMPRGQGVHFVREAFKSSWSENLFRKEEAFSAVTPDKFHLNKHIRGSASVTQGPVAKSVITP